jgi:hypothetical protein
MRAIKHLAAAESAYGDEEARPTVAGTQAKVRNADLIPTPPRSAQRRGPLLAAADPKFLWI